MAVGYQRNATKFYLQAPFGPMSSVSTGVYGDFAITPPVVASILTDVRVQAQAYKRLVGALETATGRRSPIA